MVRFIRALIYATGAAIVGSLVLDWLERRKPASTSPKPQLHEMSNEDRSIEHLDDDDKKALLDELAAQI